MSLRIHKENAPIVALGSAHPAVRTLVAHLECRRVCVGRELGLDGNPIDHLWYSPSEKRDRRFSSFAYEYLSFSLILDGWVNRPNHLTEGEANLLKELPRVRTLLEECENSAIDAGNNQVLPLIQCARCFFDNWEQCVLMRMKEDKIEDTSNS